MNGDTAHSRPTVVFVDDAPWECFFHLAAMLRKAGIRTVRISVGLPAWQSDRILFDRHVALPLPPTPEHLSKILSTEYVTDVQPTESLATTTYAALGMLPASQRSDTWIGRSAFLDKWRVASDLRDLGLRVPDTLLLEVTSPAEAVAQMSLPIVLKRKVSSSGRGVEIFETLESLQTFVNTIANPGEWFFERFIQGRSLTCGSCVSSDGIDVLATYEILKRVNLYGSSIVVEMHDDVHIAEIGKVLIGAMHIRGLVCFDIIQDSSHTDWVHDVNPRVFGGVSMCQLEGYDFCGAYVRYLLGHGRVAALPHSTSGDRAYVFPYGWKDVVQSGPRWSAWIRILRWTWHNERLLGSRYFVSLAIRGLAASLRKGRQQLGA